MAKITKKHLLRIGYEAGDALKAALVAMQHPAYEKRGRQVKLQLMEDVLFEPPRYYKHEILGPVAKLLEPEVPDENAPIYPDLTEKALDYHVYGADGIEPGAMKQMEIAARLPVAVAGALMPDAHQGYGLPIGGVLATENSIIPYAVGVDIGCRMCLSVFDLNEKYLDRYNYQLT